MCLGESAVGRLIARDCLVQRAGVREIHTVGPMSRQTLKNYDADGEHRICLLYTSFGTWSKIIGDIVSWRADRGSLRVCMYNVRLGVYADVST